MAEKENQNKEECVDWHPGFVNAIKLEFFENEKDLTYESEKLLNQQPLRIDLLVVKKEVNVKIKNELGENFLGHNIIEFKSEDDELNIDTLYKVLGYACLYKSYSTKLDEIKSNDITTTLLRKRKPLGLFKYFEEHKIKLEKVHDGIYKVDYFDFPVQIVVTKELSQENHIWVTSISRNLSENQLRKIITTAKDLQSKAEKQYISSILSVVSRLNMEELKKIKGDSNMENALYELMKPEIDEAKLQAVLKTLIELVREKLLTLEVASKKANMSQEAFQQLLSQSN